MQREAMALRSLGFKVDVFSLSETEPPAPEPGKIYDGIQVHQLPIQRKKRGASRNLLEYVAFFFLTFLSLTFSHLRNPFDVIQINTMPDFLVFASLIPRLLGAKVVLQMYEPMPELWATLHKALLPVVLLRHIQQWSIRYAHAIFVVTQSLKEKVVAHGAEANKITVVLNAPDEQLFGPPVVSNVSPDNCFTLICHGAIEERYGHDTMLRAIAAVKAFIPGLQLRILGNGSYRAEFLALREALGLSDQVQYLGYVPLDQLLTELSQADVGLVAQKASPYSHLVHTGKMYDYLALGKPVIVSRLQAVQAYFDDDSLCFFEPGNPEDLARAILELYQQPDKRRSLVASSQRLYNQYKWEKQKEIYLSVYRALSK